MKSPAGRASVPVGGAQGALCKNLYEDRLERLWHPKIDVPKQRAWAKIRVPKQELGNEEKSNVGWALPADSNHP